MTENTETMKVTEKTNIVNINEAALEKRIDEKIREGIETTLNTLLDEQADRLVDESHPSLS